MRAPRARALLLALLFVAAAAPAAHAGLADTVPQGLMIIESSYVFSGVDSRYDKHGKEGNLEQNFERYDVTGEFQGELTVPGEFNTEVWLNKVAFGITDRLTIAMVVPLFLRREVKLNLGWQEGDPLPSNDFEPFTREDFWAWAESLGQREPDDFVASKAEIGDIIVAGFYNWYRGDSVKSTFFGFVNTLTGSDRSGEIVGAVGTDFYELSTLGDLGIHLLTDYTPPYPFLDRFTFSIEGFYEHFFSRRKPAGRGLINPLLQNQAPFTGANIKIDPGDFYGWATQLQAILWAGPTDPSWLTRDNPALQENLPPTLTVHAKLTNTFSFDDDFRTPAEAYNQDQEFRNLAREKYTFNFGARVSLLRFGVPLDVFGAYTDQSLVPGKNFRPQTGFEVGVRLYGPSPFAFLVDWIMGKDDDSGEIQIEPAPAALLGFERERRSALGRSAGLDSLGY